MAPFVTLPDPTSTNPVVRAFTCTIDSAPVIIPPGNWFIDCPTLVVKTTLILQGGVVVTSGPINVVDQGCLAVNTAVCPSASALGPDQDAILYIRSGDLFKEKEASLALPQTFTYLQNGVVNLTQGPAGSLLWTAPEAQSCAADATCSNHRFRRLLLWSEKVGRHTIRGQSNLALRGVLFTPNAPFRLDAANGGQGDEVKAQFWTRKLEVVGNGTFVVAVDPDAAVARPQPGVALIR